MGGYPTVKATEKQSKHSHDGESTTLIMMVMLILGLQKHDDDDNSDTHVRPVLLWCVQ